MKSFKISHLLAFVALFVAGSIYANCCPTKRCEKKSCVRTCAACPAVKIPGEEVEYQKITKTSCGNPGSVRYILKKEYIPCDYTDQEHCQTLKGCPKYLGTFDENGNQID